MIELTKKQISAIKAVGIACVNRPSEIIRSFVFSDGANIYGTNGYIFFRDRSVAVPKGAYTPKDAEPVTRIVEKKDGWLDALLIKLRNCERFNISPAEYPAFYLSSKVACDTELKKELYQITFSTKGGDFKTEDFFSKRLINKAVNFVGKGFALYQNDRHRTCIFESINKNRIAIVMPILVMPFHEQDKIKILGDVDLKCRNS